MTEPTRRPDPGATIQLDTSAVDQILFDDSRALKPRASGPPPLPPQTPSQAPVPVAAKPKSGTRTIIIVAAFAVLLVAAILGGLRVGGLLRGDQPAASTTATASNLASAPVASPRASAAPAPASPSASASASGDVMVLPVFEVH